MSRFLSSKYSGLSPYVPGEQPHDRRYIKLNTNESPFPPGAKVTEAVKNETSSMNLYPDPDYKALREKLSALTGVAQDELIMTNGSDEILDLCFMAFCDSDTPAVFADITYGFYEVFSQINLLPYRKIPLRDDMSIDVKDYYYAKGTIFIANPNAPTGLLLTLSEIRDILEHNRKNVVVIDEAYIAFGGESAAELIGGYDNLVVTRTFSKSRSLAGGRIGFGIANKGLIDDLNRIRNSLNPYNLSRINAAAAIGAIEDNDYYLSNIEKIKAVREKTRAELIKEGFEVTDSKANFLFARTDRMGGKELYQKLREKGILVRHFDRDRIRDYIRITIGSEEQMDIFMDKIKEILD